MSKTQKPQRTISAITAEINYYKAQTAQNIIEIGKRLIEAKKQLPHGMWEQWLSKEVEFNRSTANNLMRIAEQFSNVQPVGHLPYTKLLALLALPDDEREEFVAQSHTVGDEEKTVGEMTKRELEALIKEHKLLQQQNSQLASKLNEAKKAPPPPARWEPPPAPIGTSAELFEEMLSGAVASLLSTVHASGFRTADRVLERAINLIRQQEKELHLQRNILISRAASEDPEMFNVDF